MPIFHFSQFEMNLFGNTRLNDYCAQYMFFMYEKWEIYEVVLEGITHETRANLKSMCYGGICSLNVDGM